MALDEVQAVATVSTLMEIRAGEQGRLDAIARYVRGEHDSVYVPRGARSEYHWLLGRSKVNMLRLVVSVLAQNLYVDGYRREKESDDAKPWETWQANRMDARQHGIHRAALKYGISYALVLPGEPQPIITPMSPRRMTAYYADWTNDEWPMFAVEVTPVQVLKGGKLVTEQSVRLFDDTTVYSFASSDADRAPEYIGNKAHDLSVCPVVRYLNESDLDEDESVAGEVEPLMTLQDQANSTTFNLLMAQQYAAFRQRWATGMAIPVDENGNAREPLRAAVDRLWVAEEPTTKFGEFGETSLDGYLKSREETIRQMATVSQTPPYYLLGAVANLSADALVAARDGLDRKTGERQSTFGEAHEQTLRLAGMASGDDAAWEDTDAQVVWRDTSTRSLAATVDALGKLSQTLGIPASSLWERIPGVSRQDIERWKIEAQEQDSLTQLGSLLDRQLGGQEKPNPLAPGQPGVSNAGGTPAKMPPEEIV